MGNRKTLADYIGKRDLGRMKFMTNSFGDNSEWKDYKFDNPNPNPDPEGNVRVTFDGTISGDERRSYSFPLSKLLGSYRVGAALLH